MGGGFKTRCLVDADHAVESLTQISMTRFIVILNNDPIYWHTNNKSLVETSTFRIEFMVMKHTA